MELKKIETLFHTTKSLESLTSILENGFGLSYADENSILGEIKILMVSFSNIPLIEAKSQVSYGDYSIGLSRKWGIENKLQPVAYTYSLSALECDLYHLFMESALGQVLQEIQKVSENIAPISLTNENLEVIRELLSQNHNENTLTTLKKLFENTFNKADNILHFIKHFEVLDKDNVVRLAYNDREWRYIPDKKTSNLKTLLLKSDASGILKEDYKEYSSKLKPHFKDNNLNFNLDDIKFIVVREQKEVNKVYELLFDKYTKEIVYNRIIEGRLNILALNEMWHNL